MQISVAHLMQFMVAVHVLNADLGRFAEQHLYNDVLSIRGQHAVVERRQPDGITIVW